MTEPHTTVTLLVGALLWAHRLRGGHVIGSDARPVSFPVGSRFRFEGAGEKAGSAVVRDGEGMYFTVPTGFLRAEGGR
jgi:hypothetical protein